MATKSIMKANAVYELTRQKFGDSLAIMKLSISNLPRTIHAKVFVHAEWIFLSSILIGFLINFFWPIWTIPKLIRIIFSLILGGVSVSIMLSSLDMFAKERTPINPYKQTKSLVITGPYKYSRNPQYLSRVLVQMAIGFCFGNIWIVIMVIPALVLVWYGVIIPEERYLEQRFGKKYMQYKTSTRCWL